MTVYGGGAGGNSYSILAVVGLNVSISNMTFAGNQDSSGVGGGLFNAGQVTLSNSSVSGNAAIGNSFEGYPVGAGIANGGTLTLINSSVSGNSMSGRFFGVAGGIFNGGTLTLIHSSVTGNDTSCGGECDNPGAGIYNAGTLILSSSTVQGNVAWHQDAGIANAGVMVATNSNITGNYSDGHPPGNTYIEDDCDYYAYDYTGCPVNGVNGNVTGPPQPGSPTAATPLIHPAAGTYFTPQLVTITDATPGAIIFYSTDAMNWTRCVVPVSVSSNQTLQAIAVATGFTESLIASSAYNFPGPAAQPQFSPPGGTYTGPQMVTITTSTAGATIYYTTDGSVPSKSSPVYAGPITVSSSETIKAYAYSPNYAVSPLGVATYTIIPNQMTSRRSNAAP